MIAWRSALLGDVLELAYGKGLPKQTRQADGPIPVYGSNGIAGWHDKALVNGPTVIVGRKGSAGAVQYVEGPCYPIDTTYFVRPRPGLEFDPRFTYYLLKRLDLQRLRTATGVPGLTREDVYREPITFPPIDEQRRIVDLLTRAEGIVRLRREAQRKAAELIPAIFVDMFGDPSANPKGWPRATLGELMVSGPTNGLYKHKSAYGAGVPILRIDAFYDGVVRDLSALKRVTLDSEAEFGRFELREGDIVINRVNSPEYLGKSAIIPPLAERTVFESNMMRFSVDRSRLLPDYMIALLQTGHARQHFLANAKHAINQSSINQQDVKSLQVPVPPLRLQQAFVERVQSAQSIIRQQVAAAATAQATFNALLAQAFAP